MNVLVTGAAAFLGSVVVEQLQQHGHRVVVDDAPNATTLAQQQIEAVVHLAATSPAADAQSAYRNIVGNGLALLDAMLEANVRKLVFTSSAAVYGEPATIPINEDAPTQPLNAFGEALLMTPERSRRHCVRRIA